MKEGSLIKGIDIINVHSEEVVNKIYVDLLASIKTNTVTTIILFTLLFISIILYICKSKEKNGIDKETKNMLKLIDILLIISISFCTMNTYSLNKQIKNENLYLEEFIYTVKLNNNLDIYEFNKNYEIIENFNNIYIIKEKNNKADKYEKLF